MGALVDGRLLTREVRLNQCLDATKLENRIYQSAGLSLATKLGGYFTKRKSEGVSVFPNASFHAVSNTELVYSLSIVPTSEENSLIRYDVFSSRVQDNANASDISEALKEFLNEGIEILEREYQCHVSRPEYVLSTAGLSTSGLTCSSQPIPELAPEAGGIPILTINAPAELTFKSRNPEASPREAQNTHQTRKDTRNGSVPSHETAEKEPEIRTSRQTSVFMPFRHNYKDRG